MSDCAVQIAERLQGDAEPCLRDGQPRIQPDRLAQLLDRRLEPSMAFERQPEVVAGFGMIGTQLDGGLQAPEARRRNPWSTSASRPRWYCASNSPGSS